MDFSIRLMKPEERAFAYTQDQQTLHRSGCIGHLRVDMDSTGTGFFLSYGCRRCMGKGTRGDVE